jgi:aerobic C4-dicarboxylate transport protein
MGLVRQLWFQVLVGMAAGIALGHFAPDLGGQMKPFGDGFIALVRMIIPPVIFLTVVHGVAGMEAGRVGRVAGKALVYFLAMTLLALVFGLTAVNLWRPGDGMNIDPATLDAASVAAYATAAHEQGLAPFLLGIIPQTFLSAFTEGRVLQVLLVSVLFAFALNAAGTRGKPILDMVEALQGVFFRIVGYLMWAAPVGAFGAIAFTVSKFGLAALLPLAELVGEFYLVSALFIFVVLGAVAAAIGVNLLRLIGHFRDELIVVTAVTSTEAVLPRVMQKLRDLGCQESVVGLVLPTGYSFNLDGTCLYLATASVFLAQATNTPLDLGQQLALLAILLVTSKGAAAVPGAAFVVLAASLSALDVVPVSAIALILGIHRLLAMGLVVVNLLGNTLATLVVCRWERAVDLDVLYAHLGLRRPTAVAA